MLRFKHWALSCSSGAPLLREVNRKNRAAESKGRPSSASELYLWRLLEPSCRTDPILAPVGQCRVMLGRGKGLCQTLEWGNGGAALPCRSQPLKSPSQGTLLEMLVFNQSILLSQKPQIHSFLCSGLAQDQWRPQNPTAEVQLVEECIREEEFQNLVFASGLVQLFEQVSLKFIC